MNRLRRWIWLCLSDRKTFLLFAEAFLYLGWARILLYFPFAKISPLLGRRSMETPEVHDPSHTKTMKHIRSAIQIVSRHTFWESKCLVRAMAGMKMLEKRNLHSTLYLGTGKNKNGELIAHAWLRSGSIYITGAEMMKQFVVVEKFAKSAGTDP
ncbi:lasso peptide biosynthesis B2 protein [Paenibacillus thiaminolyticus]|uniref:Lasso peptide biosynthesis B2 protein n=1 Tax=Paenibacillus thiaminolyticus TaxID=49283 RepID=A0AAP9DWQ2_PANTH|nr:lasso peptide biosynthesis B2 protein [Paenibacillus thiaminolyticus]MCY9534287.1 lasso peptide biosynthesis B2 protein [Paenibacillus thiaminolyticus]MCY9602998.1 lasso peptide biosynthesis B2 protein [Paenibacillus thiaminolyticus]MCY9608229.1 lasso peptide biosynthesis B2 protein [Paenibacillus thiaminolyticus]MCY9611597.1 lasso peptide biosynthesis B2 protein [Paenibacillus thiaminolyticus]MCY9618275.1 lasso peptide biosynthesis B2 protein [Paenibacillus thiaminolyticus]